jgi:hypothetical protein
VASHARASLFVLNVEARRLPSGPVQRARQRPEGSLSTAPNPALDVMP